MLDMIIVYLIPAPLAIIPPHVVVIDPADRTAWQRFLPSGPFALLPVRGGFHNIVWTTTPEAARKLEVMGPSDFAEAANKVWTGWSRVARV